MLGHVAFSRFLLMSCPFTCPCLSFNSDLGQLLICTQAELHAFQMIIDIKCQYLSIPMLQFQEPSSHVNVASIRSQLCRDVCVYNFYFYSPCYMYLQRDICVGLQRKLEFFLCCSSDDFMLTCHPFTDSEHLLLVQALHW